MDIPAPDTILSGPYWPSPTRVVRATVVGDQMRVESVSVAGFTDKLISLAEYVANVRELVAGVHTFDASPRLFRLATEALRTHLAHLFDPQFAVSVSQVDPLPHQIDAVYRHILPLPRIRFLLADDPGAGKTIMAGLVARELMQRHDVRRVLVLCPKALTDQWRREMWDRFRQHFTVVTGETVSNAFGQNAWAEHDLVVASVDLAAQPHIRPGLEQSNWDLIIFDEAHKLAAYRYGTKVEKTQRYQVAEALAPRTKHLLLMTATPHKGNPENFRLLLALLDRDVFASQEGAEAATEPGDSPFFLRRMKESMRNWDGSALFLPRYVITPPYDLNPHEQELYEAVTDYVQRGMQLADQSPDSNVHRNVGLALTILQRRLSSCIYSVTRSLERRHDRLASELQLLRSGATTVFVPADADNSYDDEEDDTDDFEETVSSASGARSISQLEAEVQELERLVARARAASLEGPERKLEELQRLVAAETVASGSEKILIFTEHRDTLEYLTRKLREWGRSVCVIHGGMKLQDRIAAEKQFHDSAQFLVATDAAGEGINLQFCRVMINWDLPWNPNRLEQRMGRIHRYGQRYEVQIFNLVALNTREGKVLARLMEKLEVMREAMGSDQVFDVIQEVLEAGQVRLDVLLQDAVAGRRSLDDVLADLNVLDSSAATAAARDALDDALATRFIDLTFLMGEDRESRERRLTPEFVEAFFADALRYLGGRLTHRTDNTWHIEFVPIELRNATAASNTGEPADSRALITFSKERAKHDPPATLMAPDHPLFDAIEDRILAEGRPALAQGTAFTDPNATTPSLVWLLEASAVDGNNHTAHRRLVCLRQTADSFDAVEPGVLLDLAPAESAPFVSESLRNVADSNRAVGAAAELYASEYLETLRKEREHDLAIVERALQRSFTDEIERRQARLDRQIADKEAGKDMELAIRTTNEGLDALLAERKARQDDIQRRRALTLESPRVIGVAAIIPGPVPAAWEAQSGGDKKTIELAGMAAAMEYEVAHGRTPEDVSLRHFGYDIKSAGADGSVRYIEVKAHIATGDVTLYYTEWQMANRLRDEFFIYEVNHALATPQLRIIQNPVGKGIEPEVKVVEYKIAAGVLAEFAVPAGEFE